MQSNHYQGYDYPGHSSLSPDQTNVGLSSYERSQIHKYRFLSPFEHKVPAIDTPETFQGFHNKPTFFHNTLQQEKLSNYDNPDNFQGFKTSTQDSSFSEERTRNQSPLQTYGIREEQPKHPNFSIKSTRISSYRDFPPYVCQSAESLAEAGFFYSGKEDIVFCYFCGQGLRSWEPDDDPWIEHALWSPNCVHIFNVKGPEFVKRVKQSQELKSQSGNTPGESGIKQKSSKIQKDSVDSGVASKDNGKRDLLQTVPAQSVITYGYTPELVEKAVNFYIKNNSNKSFTATDLMNIILDFEDGKIKFEEISAIANPSVINDNDHSRTIEDKPSESSSLREENRQLKEQTVCKICLDESVSIVFLPCGHLCCCSQCAPALKSCPICREFIKGTVKTYLV